MDLLDMATEEKDVDVARVRALARRFEGAAPPVPEAVVREQRQARLRERQAVEEARKSNGSFKASGLDRLDESLRRKKTTPTPAPETPVLERRLAKLREAAGKAHGAENRPANGQDLRAEMRELEAQLSPKSLARVAAAAPMPGTPVTLQDESIRGQRQAREKDRQAAAETRRANSAVKASGLGKMEEAVLQIGRANSEPYKQVAQVSWSPKKQHQQHQQERQPDQLAPLGMERPWWRRRGPVRALLLALALTLFLLRHQRRRPRAL